MKTKKLVSVDAIDDMEEIISQGFDLVRSIKNANWSYNGNRGLPYQTDHMQRACANWIETMELFNRNLNDKKK